VRIIIRKPALSQRGDTIVEVLLAMTVLALIVGASTVLANRSTRSLQQTKEGAAAQRIAQGQLEYLKAYVRTLVDKNIGAEVALKTPFCMVAQSGSGTDVHEPVSATDEACQGNPDDPARYRTVITVTQITPGAYNARVTVQWDGATVETGNINVDYRIYNVTGAEVVLKAGQVCATGKVKGPGGNCIDQPPGIKVITREVQPGRDASGGLVEVSCDQTAFNPLAGVKASLVEAGAHSGSPSVKITASAAGEASALFQPLKVSGSYRITANTPAGYRVCGSNSAGPILLGAGAENPVRDVTFTFYKPVPKKATVNVASKTYPTWHLYNAGGVRFSQDFVFTNPSGSSIALSGLNIVLTDTANYYKQLDQCSGKSLSPGASCIVRIYFWPPAGTPETNSLSVAGTKNATMTLTNSVGVSGTSVALSGKTVTNMMRAGETINTPESDLLRSYNESCYNDADSCPYYRNYIAGNGNLHIMNNYCAYRGDTAYNGYNASINMRSDGNFVFYGTDGERWSTGTFSGNYWLILYGNGYSAVTNGYDGSVVKWLNANNDGTIGCTPRDP
jgi:Tfp pilus assembly protein PilV